MKNGKTKEDKATRIIPLFTKLYSRITARKKKQLYILVLTMLFTAFVETLTLGLIAFFISSLSSPESTLNSRYIENIKNILQLGIFDNPETFILSASIAVVIFIIIKNICLACVMYLSVRYSAGLQAFFGDYLLQNFLQAEYIWYLKENPSNLVNTVNWRAHIGAFFLALLQMVTDLFFVAVVLLGLFLVQPVVTLSVFGVLGSAAGIIYMQIKKRIDRESIKVRNLQRESFVEASKAVQGIKDVKIFLKEKYFSKLFSTRVYRLVKYVGRQKVLAVAPAWFLESIGFFILMITIVIMLFMLRSTTTAVFSIIALIAVAAWKLLPALNRIAANLTRTRIAVPYIETILSYLDTPPKEAIWRGNIKKINTPIYNNVIELQNISFSYLNNEDYALRDVSCAIEKGQTVGVIGHSGAGKSTFVDILIGLLKPDEGNIKIDERLFNEEIMADWRLSIGYVSQFPYIYHGTLAQNIAFGENNENIDRTRVLDVCKMAAIDFLDKLHEGIDTIIGERGIRLSGGQRQRVAIARALYREPEILIFDEATSSLDTKNEKAIQNTIYSFKDKKTLIIIAHRLSTVESCDKLIWLENGHVIETGSALNILDKYKQEYLKLSEVERNAK